MKAIYTWHTSKKRDWLSKDFEIRTLLLSLKQSLLYFKIVELYIDQNSLNVLNQYDIPPVSIIIKDCLINEDLWVMNKTKTYSLQTEPFIHIDADFIFLKQPNEKLLNSQIAFQSIERLSNSEGFCYIPRLNNLIKNKILNISDINDVYNFGIYVCNDLNINKKYCDYVFNIGKLIIDKMKPIITYNIIVEQYLMSEILKNKNIKPYVIMDTYDESKSINLGFLHLMHNKNNNKYFEIIKNYEKI